MANADDTVIARSAGRKVRQGKSAGKTRRRETASASAPGISAQVRQAMIAEAAYFRAQQRQFAPGFDVDDWLAAEQAIDELLSAPRVQ